jgi:cobalt-zinc-cadmium efflux system membrane fusion protein
MTWSHRGCAKIAGADTLILFSDRRCGHTTQSRIGPINGGATYPVFLIGDLSTVWPTAFVRETELDGAAVSQNISLLLLALPDREF